jgi:general stress protein 26
MVDLMQLQELLNGQALGVVSSTAPGGTSQSAVVGFTPTLATKKVSDLRLIIGTSKHSRKAHNIAKNGVVSFVIFDESKRLTIQLEGTAQLIKPSELGEYRQLIIDRNPVSATYIDAPDQVYVIITPTWLRYSDISVFPWKVSEEGLQ